VEQGLKAESCTFVIGLGVIKPQMFICSEVCDPEWTFLNISLKVVSSNKSPG
jgi:hypothetical protein